MTRNDFIHYLIAGMLVKNDNAPEHVIKLALEYADKVELVVPFDEPKKEHKAPPIPEWYNDSYYYPKLNMEIDSCDLSNRAKNLLHDIGVITVGDLCSYSRSDISKFHNAGKKTVEELEDFLGIHGLRFGLDVEEIEAYHQILMSN